MRRKEEVGWSVPSEIIGGELRGLEVELHFKVLATKLES